MDRVMLKVMSMMPEYTEKHWMKLGEYFTFLYDFTRSGSSQLFYMVDKKAVMRMIDFLCRYQGHHAMYNYDNPPLEKLVLTICYVVRNQPSIKPYHEISRDFLQDKSDTI